MVPSQKQGRANPYSFLHSSWLSRWEVGSDLYREQQCSPPALYKCLSQCPRALCFLTSARSPPGRN